MEPPAPRRILVRGTNWLGDAVMTVPALLRLREKFPETCIALLTPEKLWELWPDHPAVDEIISFSPGESVFAVSKKLRAGKFDTALVLPNSPRSAIEVFLAGISNRIGYARPWRNFFLTRTIASRPDAVKMRKRSVEEIKELIGGNTESGIGNRGFQKSAHQSNEYLHLAAALGANPEPVPPKLFVTPEEIAAAGKKFGLEGMAGPVFGLNPGAEYGPAKRWPIEKFIEVAKEIRQRTNCAWILFGGKSDVEITAQIQAALGGGPGTLNLAGKTSLRELMVLMKQCRVFLTNDTGPMHVAAALGVRVVAIFGSTSPELTGPVSEAPLQILTSNAPCSPCFLRECPIDFRCMQGIGVERVVGAMVRSHT
ncbi:MAG TPA: lipopolysaccharide heptosyltransferase II [Candidatus Acidoferrales bacterium]|jgi:heptosyltransferase-2|nr:lipopolysaccharide heptosyltransferase II [Candidatus Acidoferrales bacterium]